MINKGKARLILCRYRSQTDYVWRFNARRVLLEELIFPDTKFNEDEEILAGIFALNGLKTEMGETAFNGSKNKTERKRPVFKHLCGMISNDRGLSRMRSDAQHFYRLH